jgi:hypothetical protein
MYEYGKFRRKYGSPADGTEGERSQLGRVNHRRRDGHDPPADHDDHDDHNEPSMTRQLMHRGLVAALMSTLGILSLAGPAGAVLSGRNGRIAFTSGREAPRPAGLSG